MSLKIPKISTPSLPKAKIPKIKAPSIKAPSSGKGFRVVIEGLDELQQALGDLAEAVSKQVLINAVKDGAELWANLANSEAPGPHVKIELEKATNTRVEFKIGPDKEHFYYVFFETGVQPHQIKASKGKALKFKLGDEMVFFRKVQHTGMAPAPFLVPAGKNNQERIKAAMGKQFTSAIVKVTARGGKR